MEKIKQGIEEILNSRLARHEERFRSLEQSVTNLKSLITQLSSRAAMETVELSSPPKKKSRISETRDAFSEEAIHGIREAPSPCTSSPGAPSTSNPGGTSFAEPVVEDNAKALGKKFREGGNPNTNNNNGVSALHRTEANGDVEALGALLEGGGQVYGTALNAATMKGHVDVVRRLLAEKKYVQMNNEQRTIALILSVKNKQWGTVRALVENGADPHKTLFEGKSALMVAAAEGGAESVAAMLRHKKLYSVWEALSHAKNAAVVKAFQKAVPGIVKDEGGKAVGRAACEGRLLSIAALLDAGAEIDQKGYFERTPLMYASEKGNVECVKELLLRKAHIDAVDKLGNTALHWASKKGKKDVLCALLEAGATVNKKSKAELTPLMNATANGHVKCVKELLQRGADIDAVDKLGNTALHWASKKGKKVVLCALLEARATVNKKCNLEQTPLMYASKNGHVKCVKELLLRDADIEAVDKFGNTALHLASIKGKREVLCALLEAGATVNKKSKAELTPLMNATANGHVECVKELLLRGADIDAVDDCGYTALHWASEKGNKDVVCELLDAGAEMIRNINQNKLL